MPRRRQARSWIVLSVGAEIVLHRVEIAVLPAALLVRRLPVRAVRVADRDPRPLVHRVEKDLDLRVLVPVRELRGPPGLHYPAARLEGERAAGDVAVPGVEGPSDRWVDTRLGAGHGVWPS